MDVTFEVFNLWIELSLILFLPFLHLLALIQSRTPSILITLILLLLVLFSLFFLPCFYLLSFILPTTCCPWPPCQKWLLTYTLSPILLGSIAIALIVNIIIGFIIFVVFSICCFCWWSVAYSVRGVLLVVICGHARISFSFFVISRYLCVYSVVAVVSVQFLFFKIVDVVVVFFCWASWYAGFLRILPQKLLFSCLFPCISWLYLLHICFHLRLILKVHVKQLVKVLGSDGLNRDVINIVDLLIIVIIILFIFIEIVRLRWILMTIIPSFIIKWLVTLRHMQRSILNHIQLLLL